MRQKIDAVPTRAVLAIDVAEVEPAVDTALAPKRFRLVVDVEANALDDLAYKLQDVATDLMRDMAPRKAVFASPSCRGTTRMWERNDAD